MGFIKRLFNNKDRTLEEERETGEGGIINGLLRTGKYAKTDEQRQAEKEAKSLPNKLENLYLKKCNNQISFRFDNNNRIEVGENFTMDKLPDIIYLLAEGSTPFRREIKGGFDFSEREKLRRIIRKKRNKIQKIERQLNGRNKRKHQVCLKELF